MSLQIYRITQTGESEAWGVGIQDPELVKMYPGFVQLREGVTVDQVENPTISLEEITDPDEVEELTAKYNLIFPPRFF